MVVAAAAAAAATAAAYYHASATFFIKLTVNGLHMALLITIRHIQWFKAFLCKKTTSEARANAAATAAAAAATAAACTMFHCSLQYFFTLKQS